jgi:hypothetical protein
MTNFITSGACGLNAVLNPSLCRRFFMLARDVHAHLCVCKHPRPCFTLFYHVILRVLLCVHTHLRAYKHPRPQVHDDLLARRVVPQRRKNHHFGEPLKYVDGDDSSDGLWRLVNQTWGAKIGGSNGISGVVLVWRQPYDVLVARNHFECDHRQLPNCVRRFDRGAHNSRSAVDDACVLLLWLHRFVAFASRSTLPWSMLEYDDVYKGKDHHRKHVENLARVLIGPRGDVDVDKVVDRCTSSDCGVLPTASRAMCAVSKRDVSNDADGRGLPVYMSQMHYDWKTVQDVASLINDYLAETNNLTSERLGHCKR